MAEQRVKRVIVALPIGEYEKLAAAAVRDTREPDQQAAHYVRRALQRQGGVRPRIEVKT